MSGKDIVSVRDLRFAYRGAKTPAVDGMAFSVAPGEVFGFLGPSGAGKSTTQKVLVRLLQGYAGSVHVLGRELSTWGPEYFERVGVSFELPNHYRKLTARENLRLFASLYRDATEDPDALLGLLGLADAADQRVGSFSKGMQMRLNLARALLPRPDLLFLDEPTSGLDPVNVALVTDLVRAQRDRGCTVFLTTHDMQTANDLCDRVAFVVDGRIARIGDPRRLRLEAGERRVVVRTAGRPDQADWEFPLDGLGEDQRFLELLRGGVETIHTTEPSLAQVFRTVTGRRLP